MSKKRIIIDKLGRDVAGIEKGYEISVHSGLFGEERYACETPDKVIEILRKLL